MMASFLNAHRRWNAAINELWLALLASFIGLLALVVRAASTGTATLWFTL